MLNQFIEFVETNKLFDFSDYILAAVSGGADSVAMVDLLHKSGYKFAIAHFNFKLRGKDSDIDEEFVINLAQKYNVEVFTHSEDTKQYASDRHISIEMAARKLRYDWFNTLLSSKGFTKIATAHHQDDNVETILLNMAKKTGLRGLCGIPLVNNNIVRPLLFSNKKQILQYCLDNNLQFRIDLSNLQNDFERNKIRNLIIPQFHQITSSFENNVIETSNTLKKYLQLIEHQINLFVKTCTKRKNGEIEVYTDKIFDFMPVDVYLYEFLKDFGFNSTQINSLISSIDKVGKTFLSKTHKIIVDRKKIIIYSIQNIDRQKIVVNNIALLNNIRLDNQILHTQIIDKSQCNIDKTSNNAYFDVDKLQLPIVFRHWQKGDYFIPFGLGKRKKLSDFFVDKKINIVDKSKLWIMLSGGNICWVVGYRTDDRFKIDENTQKVLVVTIER